MFRFPSRTQLSDTARGIPAWANVLTVAAWVSIQLLVHWGFAQERNPPHLAFQIGFGLYMATLLAPLVLLAGIVNADSKLRRMNSALWTAIALVPPGIGALLYLLFRVPTPVDCSRCGRRLRPQSAYCAACGQAAGDRCGHCHREIVPGDSFCSHCGGRLAAA
jgi:hypothetical protein